MAAANAAPEELLANRPSLIVNSLTIWKSITIAYRMDLIKIRFIHIDSWKSHPYPLGFLPD
ncbi:MULTISPECIES: hypothetical protein [Peribacillus]|uniref:hypothetical protein n=1 Tax=Peribacillus TaxID=2675229 RepID=UPI003014279A